MPPFPPLSASQTCPPSQAATSKYAILPDRNPQSFSETQKLQSVSSTLLRASSAHDTPSELLLRGSMSVAEEDAPQQLLRASVSEEKLS